MEIEQGIAKLRRGGGLLRAERLADWLAALLHLYAPRILLLDLDTSRQLGILSDAARAGGHMPGLADLAIAATAIVHHHTILTRNLRHFHMLGVTTHDPFERLPA